MSMIIASKDKLNPKAKVRNKGDCCCPAEHPKVKDDKDHFPVTSEAQGRNAIARVNQYSSAPSWWNGSLKELINTVYRKVHGKYKGIEIDPAKKKPGKQASYTDRLYKLAEFYANATESDPPEIVNVEPDNSESFEDED